MHILSDYNQLVSIIQDEKLKSPEDEKVLINQIIPEITSTKPTHRILFPNSTAAAMMGNYWNEDYVPNGEEQKMFVVPGDILFSEKEVPYPDMEYFIQGEKRDYLYYSYLYRMHVMQDRINDIRYYIENYSETCNPNIHKPLMLVAMLITYVGLYYNKSDLDNQRAPQRYTHAYIPIYVEIGSKFLRVGGPYMKTKFDTEFGEKRRKEAIDNIIMNAPYSIAAWYGFQLAMTEPWLADKLTMNQRKVEYVLPCKELQKKKKKRHIIQCEYDPGYLENLLYEHSQFQRWFPGYFEEADNKLRIIEGYWNDSII